MTTKTLETRYLGAAWAPLAFKSTAAITFAIGAAIHATRLVIGVEELVRSIVTPPFDVAFGALMVVAAIAGLLSWCRYAGGPGGRTTYAFMMVVLIASVPLHLRTLVTWSTEFFVIFPPWYSAAEVPMFVALSYLAARLKFERSNQRC